ncbi:MAG: hypothetical protein BWX48_02541 [Verrucomicrobia bacterium ADurb.Bin006]|nr:MAG: hypothetical protein BWX48_02541 [Verrucomicrobia bacterium ADurb.Bin006]
MVPKGSRHVGVVYCLQKREWKLRDHNNNNDNE